MAQAFDYYDSVVSNDIKRVDDIDRDEELTKRIMRSYARNQGTQATVGTILADIKATEMSGCQTVLFTVISRR